MRRATRQRIGGSRREAGVVAVEFAIILPFLALLIVGIFDIGVLTMDHQILQNAAREGARYGSLPGNEIRQDAAALNRIRQRVIDYLALEDITVAPGDITVVQGAPGCEIDYADSTRVGCTRVEITYTKTLMFPGLHTIGAGGVDLNGVAVFRNLFGN